MLAEIIGADSSAELQPACAYPGAHVTGRHFIIHQV